MSRGVDQIVDELISFREIENLMPLKEYTDKNRMFQTLLNNQALNKLEYHLRRRLKAKESELPDNEIIERVLRDIGLE
jgi:hypothetical protein